jgi:hypothetical protein
MFVGCVARDGVLTCMGMFYIGRRVHVCVDACGRAVMMFQQVVLLLKRSVRREPYIFLSLRP